MWERKIDRSLIIANSQVFFTIINNMLPPILSDECYIIKTKTTTIYSVTTTNELTTDGVDE